MKTAIFVSLLCAADAFTTAPTTVKQTVSLRSSATDDDNAMKELKSIATAANPVVNYYDPLDLVNFEGGRTQSERIGWLRHAEIKHGRVAMAAFVGYWVQANHFLFTEGPWTSTDLGPEAQWDTIPEGWKWNIILAVGALELFDEADSNGHYTKGREPGRHPAYQGLFSKDPSTSERRARGKIKEINNGRLAMLGIMGFVSSSSVPGAVPLLSQTSLPAYEGNFWAPFQANWSLADVQGAASGAAAAVSSAIDSGS